LRFDKYKNEVIQLAKGKLTFDINECKGCGLCVEVCPKKILELDEKTINVKGIHPVSVIDMDQCIACGNCGIMCPDAVITIEKV
jgi:2-oxoglutarate ferredoxin oxidoreductase subunit delta